MKLKGGSFHAGQTMFAVFIARNPILGRSARHNSEVACREAVALRNICLLVGLRSGMIANSPCMRLGLSKATFGGKQRAQERGVVLIKTRLSDIACLSAVAAWLILSGLSSTISRGKKKKQPAKIFSHESSKSVRNACRKL